MLRCGEQWPIKSAHKKRDKILTGVVWLLGDVKRQATTRLHESAPRHPFCGAHSTATKKKTPSKLIIFRAGGSMEP